MTALVWDEAPIAKRHDRAAFDCGDPDLNLYLQRFARQNHESGGAKCFVAAPSDAPARILGFYTLSPGIDRIQPDARCRDERSRPLRRACVSPRPAGGRSNSMQGRGLGGALLLRAAERCIRVAEDVGGVALLIDAKNERAARWYESYGALPLLDAPLSLVLPLAVAADALKRGS